MRLGAHRWRIRAATLCRARCLLTFLWKAQTNTRRLVISSAPKRLRRSAQNERSHRQSPFHKRATSRARCHGCNGWHPVYTGGRKWPPARELSRGLGAGPQQRSVENEVRSLLNLMSVHVVLGDAKTALLYSQHALRLSEDFGGRRLAAMTRLEMAHALMGGPRWRLAGAILPTLADAFPDGSYNWLFCKAFEAIYLAKIGEPSGASLLLRQPNSTRAPRI